MELCQMTIKNLGNDYIIIEINKEWNVHNFSSQIRRKIYEHFGQKPHTYQSILIEDDDSTQSYVLIKTLDVLFAKSLLINSINLTLVYVKKIITIPISNEQSYNKYIYTLPDDITKPLTYETVTRFKDGLNALFKEMANNISPGTVYNFKFSGKANTVFDKSGWDDSDDESARKNKLVFSCYYEQFLHEVLTLYEDHDEKLHVIDLIVLFRFQ